MNDSLRIDKNSILTIKNRKKHEKLLNNFIWPHKLESFNF